MWIEITRYKSRGTAKWPLLNKFCSCIVPDTYHALRINILLLPLLH